MTFEFSAKQSFRTIALQRQTALLLWHADPVINRTLFVSTHLDAIDVLDSPCSSASALPFGDRCEESHGGAVHMRITTIGLDIAKDVF